MVPAESEAVDEEVSEDTEEEKQVSGRSTEDLLTAHSTL